MHQRKRLLFFAAIFAVFLFLFVLNLLTPLCVDDFTYLFHFADGSRIRLPLDIISSMRAHGEKMNGRLFSHGINQLFLLMPDGIFDAVNSLAFVFSILFVYFTAKGHRKHSGFDPLGILVVFCALWLILPAFGEVVLWQTGSVGYLWFFPFCFLFLSPFMQAFRGEEKRNPLLFRVFFVLFAFPCGGYLESGSAAMIGMAALFLLASLFLSKHRPPLYLFFALLSAVGGYLFMLTRPAELMNKAVFTADALLGGFSAALAMYRELLFPFLLFFALFLLAVYKKRDAKRIITASVFLLGSLASNFIMCVAAYYPARCAASPAMFLLLADAILMHDCFAPILQQRQGKQMAATLLVLSLFVSLYPLAVGTKDIAETGLSMQKAESLLTEAERQGETLVYLPILKSETKYGVLFELKYLDTDPTTWPNHDMAKHHGLDAVIGVYMNEN